MLIGPHPRIHISPARKQSANRSDIPSRRRAVQRRMTRRSARFWFLLLIERPEAGVADGHDVLALATMAVFLTVIRRDHVQTIFEIFPVAAIAVDVAVPLKDLAGMPSDVGANSAAQRGIVKARIERLIQMLVEKP